MKEDSSPPKVSSPKVSSPEVSSPKVKGSQGRTNKMIDNLLEDVGLKRDTGGSA